jgi:N utilization substance protein B
MGKRREARERAVQFLFQHDLSPPEDLDRALDEFWQTQRAAAIAEDKGPANWGVHTELPPPTAEESATRLFAEPLIRGTLEHRDAIDEHIKNTSELGLQPHRRRGPQCHAPGHLRNAHRRSARVSINEAGGHRQAVLHQDSGKFVNGLDKVKAELMRPARIVK